MRRSGFRGEGRRLADGAAVNAPPVGAAEVTQGVVLVAVAAAAIATCPSHDSLESFCSAAADHPSGFLGGVIARLHAAISAESQSYLLFRLGRFRGQRFVGAFRTWVSLPTVPVLVEWPFTAAICRGKGEGTPHELFALVCVLVFILAQVAPRLVWRHCTCSWSAVRSGRPWVMVTANFTHFSPVHLLHNVLQVLQLGPIVYQTLGCEKTAALLALASLAASSASVLFHWVRRQPSAGSVGGSGVAMALMAANAALFPHVVVRMYGFELDSAAAPLLFILLDVLSQGSHNSEIDVSAHIGGALCGWMLVQRWRPWWSRL